MIYSSFKIWFTKFKYSSLFSVLTVTFFDCFFVRRAPYGLLCLWLWFSTNYANLLNGSVILLTNVFIIKFVRNNSFLFKIFFVLVVKWSLISRIKTKLQEVRQQANRSCRITRSLRNIKWNYQFLEYQHQNLQNMSAA